MSSVEPGFDEVAAQVAPALRGAAALILEAPQEAHALVVALLTDAGWQWSQWREEQPVHRLGAELLIRAHHAASRSADPGSHPQPRSETVEPGTPPAQLLAAIVSGSDATTRTLLAGRALLDRGETETRQLLGIPADVTGDRLGSLELQARRASAAAHWFGDLDTLVREVHLHPDAGALLEEVSGRLRRRTIRRRLVLTGGLAGVGGIVAGVAYLGPDHAEPGAAGPTASPASRQRRTGEGGGHGSRFGVVNLQTMPPPGSWAALPELPNAVSQTGIPAEWGLADAGAAPSLTRLGRAPGSIRAAFLHDVDGELVPILHIPRHDPPYVALDGLELGPPTGDALPFWGPRLIDDRRRRIAIARAGRLTLVEPGTGTIRHIALPVRDVVGAGWAVSSQWFVVVGGSTAVRVDPEHDVVEEIAGPAAYGRQSLAMLEGGLQLVGADFRGSVLSRRPLPGPVQDTLGPSVSNLEGWVAGGVRVSRYAVGLLAAAWDLSPRVSLLSTPGSSLTGPPIALGWAPADVLLFLGISAVGSFALGWDVVNNATYRLAELPGPDGTSWTGKVSLSP